MKTIIIAEAGVNHNGKTRFIKKLIKKAAEAKVDYIKFQAFKADQLVKRDTKKAEYQKLNTDPGETQYEMLKKLELTKTQYNIIQQECKKRKIKHIFSPFDETSLKIIKKFNLDFIKIPSGEIDNLPLLQEIAKLNKKIILSTGMSTNSEIANALRILTKKNFSKKKITLLQCNTDYPTKFEDVNLYSMLKMQKKFKLDIGLSDHTIGIEASLAAVSMGAKIIEKHFTISKKFKGPDHKASLDPSELKKLVLSIRNIEKCFGKSKKTPTKRELKNKKIVRKSIVAKRNIQKGEKFRKENLTTKRPGNGISPMKFNELINLKAKKIFLKDELIKI